MTPTAPGWYDDPQQPDQLRYFDGIVWTSHVVPRSTRPATPAAAPPTAPPDQAPQPADPYGWRTPGSSAPTETPPSTPGQWQQPTPPGQQWQQPGQWQQQPWAQAGPATPDGVPLAGYFQRVGAVIIDALITGLLTSVLGGWLLWRAIGPWWSDLMTAAANNDTNAMDNLSQNLADRLSGPEFVGFALIQVLVGLLYNVFFLTRSGATPGKKVLGISVRLRDRPGPLTLVTALRREALNLAVGLVGLVPSAASFLAVLLKVANYLWPAWDGNRQALHDKIAATNVVRGPQPPRSR